MVNQIQSDFHDGIKKNIGITPKTGYFIQGKYKLKKVCGLVGYIILMNFDSITCSINNAQQLCPIVHETNTLFKSFLMNINDSVLKTKTASH